MMKRNIRSKYLAAFFVLFIFSATGCSLERFTIRSTGAVLKYGVASLYEEQDLALAEQAIMADMKLLEGLILGDPKNKNMLFLAAQGFTGYALGFVEDEDPERAKIFYARARDYGLRALSRKKAFRDSLNGNIDDLTKGLKALTKADVPVLFWTTNAWGSLINISRNSLSAIADMGKVEAMMQRVLELDENYYYGAPHMFFAVFYGSRSKMFGGDPDKAVAHFDKFVEISGDKFLLGHVLFAKFHAVQTQDVELYTSLLKKAIEAPGDILPEQRLVNEIARAKAVKLLKDKELYF